jgi:hypothetical protein
MSACFNTAKAVMIGFDPHIFISVLVVAGVPVPVPSIAPHLCGATFASPTCTTWKRLPSVTADGSPMIQRGFDLYLVPHFPLTALPWHPTEPAVLALVVLTSKSVARMHVGSVRGGGSPLATCVIGGIGANANCAEPIDVPLDIVINPGTVVTSPTLADYVASLAYYIVSTIFGKLLGKQAERILDRLLRSELVRKVVLAILKQVIRRRSDIAKRLSERLKDPAEVVTDGVRNLVQRIAKALQ